MEKKFGQKLNPLFKVLFVCGVLAVLAGVVLNYFFAPEALQSAKQQTYNMHPCSCDNDPAEEALALAFCVNSNGGLKKVDVDNNCVFNGTACGGGCDKVYKCGNGNEKIVTVSCYNGGIA